MLSRTPASLLLTLFFAANFLAALTICPLLAQEQTDKEEIKYPVEMLDYFFAVQDENQAPIAGVVVSIRGLRCEEDRGSWYGWPTSNAGPIQKLTTDEQGQVKLQYPIQFGLPVDWKTTTVICLSISHPDYIFEDIELSVDGKQPVDEEAANTQTLKQGCHVSFTAKDANDQPLEKFAVLMAGAGRAAEWKMEDGVVESKGVPDGSLQTMLVSVDSEGVPIFSGVLPARYAKGKSFSIKNVELRRGLRVRGTIDARVPRPIANGVVIGFSVPKPESEQQAWQTHVTWNDYAVINEDGSFNFASLPPTGDLQFIAVCDGWVSKDAGWENNQTWTVQGLFHPLTEEETEAGSIDIGIAMEQTGSVEVTVRDEDDQPVPDIKVYSWPNQVYHRFGSTILGSHYRTLDLLLHKMDPEQYSEPEEWPDSERYADTTNENGVAVIHGIPVKRRESIMAANERYATVDDVGFQCESANEMTKVNVRVQKIAD